MTDLRRTLLWVVFSMSLVLIWDAWNRHNGEPSMFGPAPVAKPAAAGASTAPGAVPVPSVATPTAAIFWSNHATRCSWARCISSGWRATSCNSAVAGATAVRAVEPPATSCVMLVVLLSLIGFAGRLVEHVEEVVNDRVDSLGECGERRRERRGSGVDDPSRGLDRQ